MVDMVLSVDNLIFCPGASSLDIAIGILFMGFNTSSESFARTGHVGAADEGEFDFVNDEWSIGQASSDDDDDDGKAAGFAVLNCEEDAISILSAQNQPIIMRNVCLLNMFSALSYGDEINFVY